MSNKIVKKAKKYVKENKKKSRVIMGFVTVLLIIMVVGIANPNIYKRLLGNTAMIDSGFEDEFLYQKVVEEYNRKHGASKTVYDILTDEELATINTLSIVDDYNQYSITSTNGIEKLTGLESLQLNHLEIGTIDLSKNINLRNINLASNNLTSLDLTKNEHLSRLSILNNRIINIPNKIVLGKNYTINLDSLKLPSGFQISFSTNDTNTIEYSNYNLLGKNEGQFHLSMYLDESGINYMDLYQGEVIIPKLITSWACVNDEQNKKLFVGRRFEGEQLKDLIRTNIGEIKIENNLIKVVEEGQTLLEYEIVYVDVDYNNYKIFENNDEEVLYLKADSENEAKNNINITNGFFRIEHEEDNSLAYIHANTCVDEGYSGYLCEPIYELLTLGVSSSNYNLNNKYIYLGGSKIENDIDVILHGNSIKQLINDSEDEEKENYQSLLGEMIDVDSDKVKLYSYEEEKNCGGSGDSGYVSGSISGVLCLPTYSRTDFMIDSWDIIKVTSDDYKISDNTITLTDEQVFDLSKVNVTNSDKTTLEVNNNELVVKYEGQKVGSLNIVGGKKVTTTSKAETTTTNKVQTTTTSKKITTTKKSEDKNIVEIIIDKIFKTTTTTKEETKIEENNNDSTVKKTTKKQTTISVKDNSAGIDEENSQTASIRENTIVGIITAFVIGTIVCLILLGIKKRKNS